MFNLYCRIEVCVSLIPCFSSFNPGPRLTMMAFVQRMRSPSLSFTQTFVSLLLSTTALMSSYWCVGQQKVPKPLCSATKQSRCIPVPGVSNSSRIQFFWETGDDRFVFPNFHTGLFIICEENIYIDEWGERKKGNGLKWETFDKHVIDFCRRLQLCWKSEHNFAQSAENRTH